jgi:hypothetical protein
MLMSRHQTAGQNFDIKAINKFFEMGKAQRGKMTTNTMIAHSGRDMPSCSHRMSVYIHFLYAKGLEYPVGEGTF